MGCKNSHHMLSEDEYHKTSSIHMQYNVLNNLGFGNLKGGGKVVKYAFIPFSENKYKFYFMYENNIPTEVTLDRENMCFHLYFKTTKDVYPDTIFMENTTDIYSLIDVLIILANTTVIFNSNCFSDASLSTFDQIINKRDVLSIGKTHSVQPLFYNIIDYVTGMHNIIFHCDK